MTTMPTTTWPMAGKDLSIMLHTSGILGMVEMSMKSKWPVSQISLQAVLAVWNELTEKKGLVQKSQKRRKATLVTLS